MTIETINVKGNASKALEDHHNRLKTEAKEPVDGLHLNEPKKNHKKRSTWVKKNIF